MSDSQLKPIIESLIMVSTSPITAEKLCQCIDDESVTTKDIRDAIALLMEDYQDKGIELVKVASGYRFQAKTKYKQWYQKLFEEKPAKYSRATLETLAIIAYRQPVTRADIESVRGVAVSTSIMKTLLEREWIKVVGHRDVPGKPSIYATTKQFLDYFNLEKLDDLPTLAEIKDISDVVSQPQSDESLDDNMVLEEHTDIAAELASGAEILIEEPLEQKSVSIAETGELSEQTPTHTEEVEEV